MIKVNVTKNNKKANIAKRINEIDILIEFRFKALSILELIEIFASGYFRFLIWFVFSNLFLLHFFLFILYITESLCC